VVIPGDGHRLMQFVYVNDLVHAMVRAMTESRAVGEAFNIGDPKTLTQVELVEKLGSPRHHPPGRRRRHGGAVLFRPILRPSAHHRKHRQSRAPPETKPTPFETGLKETYRWYTRNHKPRTTGFEFEDRLLGRAGSPASV